MLPVLQQCFLLESIVILRKNGSTRKPPNVVIMNKRNSASQAHGRAALC